MKKLLLLILPFLFSINLFSQMPNESIAPNWTLEDINGNMHTLYDYLDQGYAVVIDFSATWCGPCWSYHNSGNLENLYDNYGPDGTKEVMVFFIEGDASTSIDDLYGTGGNTQGNWVAGTPYPIINNSATANEYDIAYWPTIYLICQNRTISEIGQKTTAQIYAASQICPQPEFAHDVSIENFLPESGIECSDSIQAQLNILNNGTETITSMDIVYSLDNENESTYHWTGDLALYSSTNIDLPVIKDLTEDMHSILVTVQSVNETTDDNVSDNLAHSNIYVNPDGTSVKMYFISDTDPENTSWKIEKEGQLIVESTSYDIGDHVYLENLCLDEGQCYDFTIIDESGSGLSSVYVKITYNGEDLLVISGGDSESEITETFCVGQPSNATQQALTTQFEIYPNPGNGIFNLKNASQGMLFVYDILGNEIYHQSISNENSSFDLSAFRQGLYFVKVYSKQKVFGQLLKLN